MNKTLAIFKNSWRKKKWFLDKFSVELSSVVLLCKSMERKYNCCQDVNHLLIKAVLKIKLYCGYIIK